MGKHVYCEKPLTWSVHEARVLRETAKRRQTGHADGQPGPLEPRGAPDQRVDSGRRHRPGARSLCLDQPPDLAAGRLAPRQTGPAGAGSGVTSETEERGHRRVIAQPGQGPGRRRGRWPEAGYGLPAFGNEWTQRRINKVTAATILGDYPVPATLNWDLYLGPGPEVPYHPIYHPFNWRGWVD